MENTTEPNLTRFDGQNGIVTGSTLGLGEATARLLAKRGMAGLIITGRNPDRGAKVVADLREHDCNAVFVEAELSDVEACRRIFAKAEAVFGSVHVLVNAAGSTARGTVFDTSVEFWDEMMAINLRAPFLLTQACVKLMRQQQIEGAIVNVLSVSAYGGQPFLMPYSTSKAALAAFTKNVAYGVMRYRIRVNGLMLGWMDSPGEDMVQRQCHTDGQDWLEEAEAGLPFGRLIKTHEAARAIAWLASRESGLMTGALVNFDQSVPGAGEAPRPVPGESGTE